MATYEEVIRKFRWKLEVRRRSLKLHLGLLGMDAYWGGIQASPTNCIRNESWWGFVLMHIPRRPIPGANLPCWSFLRRIDKGETEWPS